MQQGRYPGVDSKHPLYDTPIIEAAHADSALCLKATGGAPQINMCGPLDLGKDNHGIVKLNDGSPVEHSFLTIRPFSGSGIHPAVDKSVATLGTKDHQLKSLVVYPGALLAADYHAYSYENLNHHAVAQVGEDSVLHDVA
ncbi:hypothetical protein [Candidatus Tisiphia endosymbiont of Beris chalybata]|uniref:hypothetical protein n=1 Tax=Candidatus Tisiphia endosymbiont of Beris chalybata TaxID=3066262 RepID=UPI00312C8B2A